MKTLLKIFTGIGIATTILLVVYASFKQPSSTQEYINETKGLKNLQFDLVDPEQAPKALRDTVERGYRLVIQTHLLLPNYVGDRLDCSSCHFAGGITTGGVNGGISLAGVAAKYPRYNHETRSIEDLPARVNSCFTKSMNGKVLPVEGKDMQAIITYLTWISARYPIYEIAPWLGVKPLKSTHTPDPIRGLELYKVYCMDCHKADGNGSASAPPIFGKNSYNNSAGMHRIETFASFIYHNMPLDDPSLQVSEALDIAAYVHTQPRPEKKE